MQRQVFLTVPKYVAISPNPLSKPFSRARSVTSSASEDEEPTKGRKRRLDHLSWDEKVQRKKLKNRVAAQTSRDRKKARMEEMDETIKKLTEKTEILQNKCESLQTMNESLMEKNQKLDIQVEQLTTQLKSIQELQKANVSDVSNCIGCKSNFKGSAVSNFNPLPKGMELQSTQYDNITDNLTQFNGKSVSTLLKIIALCLLYKTYSKNSMPANWRSLPKAYSLISPQTWKNVLQKAARMMPKMQAQRSDCLDQWWGPHQKSWNPVNIQAATTTSISA